MLICQMRVCCKTVRTADKYDLRGPFEKFVDWRQSAAVIAKQRRTATSPRTFQMALIVAPHS
jgi:hypothetical protein